MSPGRRPRAARAVAAVVVAAAAVATATAPAPAAAHGCLTSPRVRGALPGFLGAPKVADGPLDTDIHGRSAGGVGAVAAGPPTATTGWAPFAPTAGGPVRRDHGVCGDVWNGAKDHERGGVFYGVPVTTAVWQQGGLVDLEYLITAHHRGYLEFRVCDVDKCGGEISHDCFETGACQTLTRATAAEDGGLCAGGDVLSPSGFPECGPVQPEHPTRWYVPCTVGGPMWLGGRRGGLRFRLPPSMTCEHCVLQAYYVGFQNCLTDEGAKTYAYPATWKSWPGGCVNTEEAICDGGVLPEEFWGCSVRLDARPVVFSCYVGVPLCMSTSSVSSHAGTGAGKGGWGGRDKPRSCTALTSPPLPSAAAFRLVIPHSPSPHPPDDATTTHRMSRLWRPTAQRPSPSPSFTMAPGSKCHLQAALRRRRHRQRRP